MKDYLQVLQVKSVPLFVKALAIAIAAELIGSVLSAGPLAQWYLTLAKPALVPPGIVFAIVWGILYLLIGLSLYLVWLMPKSKGRILAVRIFYVQLALNVLWSFAFFTLHSPLLGLIDILLLLNVLVWNIVLFYRLSKNAAYLLVPYLLWIVFATYLNWWILVLNR